MTRTPSVLAVADHAGWANVLCISARDRRPFVVARRRIVLIDPGLPMQPYHHETLEMRAGEADDLVARVRKSVAAKTTLELQLLVDELSREHSVTGLTTHTTRFPSLPASVAAVHASYAMQCAADGMLYNLAIASAAKGLGIEVQPYRRGSEIALAAAALGTSTDAVEEFVRVRGRPAGPPWSAEHRHAYAAGIAALAPLVRRLTID